MPFTVSDSMTLSDISLSASGSMSLPKSVTKLYFLAIYPSATSVRLATANTPSAQ